jgi:acylphosphatase
MAGARAVRLLIKGRVQGVGYRDWAMDEARALGLDGWVRNLRNGDVEALVSGPEAEVDHMIEACRRGPALARVSDIEITPAAPPPEHGFRRLPTA